MNNQADRPDTHLIATLVAAELPGTWSVNVGRDNYSKVTRDSDGLELTIAHDNAFGSPADRLDIHQSWHTPAWADSDGTRHDPTGYGESLPGIKVTAKKRAAVIARDIVRRLLPDAEQFHAIGLARVAAYDAADNEKTTLERDAGVADGNVTRFEGYSDVSARVETSVSSCGVDLKLENLSAEQARAVMFALGLALLEKAAA